MENQNILVYSIAQRQHILPILLRQIKYLGSLQEIFNINEFKTTLANRGGLARTNLFAVEIPLPPIFQQAGSNYANMAKDLHFFCLATELPGMSLETTDIRRYGYGPTEKNPYNVKFADLDLVFMGDQIGGIYTYFQEWLKAICNSDSRQGWNQATGIEYDGTPPNGSIQGNQFAYELNYKQTYCVDMNINLYDPTGTIQEAYQLTIQQAFPILMNDIQLSWDDNNSFMKIPVKFAFYDYYRTNAKSGPSSITFNSAATIAQNLAQIAGGGVAASGSQSFITALNQMAQQYNGS